MVNIIGRRIDIQPTGSTAPDSSAAGIALAKLGQTLFGYTLTPELKRRQVEHLDLQNAKASREYDRTGALAALASNPSSYLGDIIGNATLAGYTPGQTGDLLRVLSANFNGANDPRTTNAYIGAGGAYGGTVAGTREGEATKLRMAELTAQRQADSQFRVAGLTPVEAIDQGGAPTWTTRADIANGTATQNGLAPVLSTDQVVGGQIQRRLASPPQVPGGGPQPPGGPSPIPTGPQADPFDNLPNSLKKKAGVYFEPSTFINPRSNTVAVSFDGGSWGVTDSGEWMPLRSGPWVPAGKENAVGESRLALMKMYAERGNPNLAERDPLTGQVARSAYKATGVDAFGQQHANALLGSLGVTRLFGAGELGPEYERARSNLQVFRQTAKNAFMNSPTSPIKEQAMIDDMLPGPSILANPESEARKVSTLFLHLKADNDRLQKQIGSAPDFSTANRANQALEENERALEMLTRGAVATGQPGQPSGAPPRQAPPQAGPAPQPPAPQAGGVTHVWTPDGGLKGVGR